MQNTDDDKRIDTSSLYPTAKTYDEIAEYNSQRQERYQKRLPKLPYLRISVPGAIMFALADNMILQTRDLWMGGGAFGGVHISFLLWMIIAGGVFAWLRYASSIFYAYNKSMAVFWFVFFIAAVVGVVTQAISRIIALGTVEASILSAFLFCVTMTSCLAVVFGKNRI